MSKNIGVEKMADLAYKNMGDNGPDSGVREVSRIRRRPPARTFSARLLESVKDTINSVRSFAVSLNATRRDPNDVIENIEKTPTPSNVVFAQYKPRPEGAIVYHFRKE